LSNNTLSELLSTLILFLSSANREIVRSAIGFVKVAIVTLSATVLEPTLPSLIPALVNWSHEHSNHFKVKIRHILERLIRKFGIDKVEREVPEDDKKLIQNIRKRQMRSKKKKAKEDEEGDADMADAEVRDERFMPRCLADRACDLRRRRSHKRQEDQPTTKSCTVPTRMSRHQTTSENKPRSGLAIVKQLSERTRSVSSRVLSCTREKMKFSIYRTIV
jgi:hypothetical protein